MKDLKLKSIAFPLAAIAFGAFFGNLMTVSPANAAQELTEPVVGDGTCAPHTDYVCGLNNVNYENKEFVH